MSESANSTVDIVQLTDEVCQHALPLLQQRLDDYGFLHSCKTAETARSLAECYGSDPQLAYTAALLHDWDRGQAADDLLSRAADIGIEVTDEVRAAPQILHAHTGAAAIRELFPQLPESVITAIRHHTVGAYHMSDLDKIVYIADMIEPSRSSQPAAELRALVAVTDLDRLFLQAYQATVLSLIRNKKVMHFHTTQVWNALIMKGTQ
ncbi:MAG: bis(5'-nucleosyl)-tetraphosphatase (symmetrical) YqeK [Coriobacteriia bacterium]|nr:bis(5'-nucleosyl)-tetraphosphatase (symmetrical) YqeK [Coriobacteriia bacterium]